MDKAWIEFKKKIETALQTEMGQCTVDKGIPGCKISNAHVRLTSGLHLRDFFHAELLLQNGSILKGFAKQLVKYIEANRRKEENIFLIGCEGYSELLIQEVAFELKPVLKSEAEVQYAIFADNAFRKQNAISGFGDNRMMYSPALYSKARAERVDFIKNASVFVVSPISTTFSSYLNLLDHLQQEVEEKNNPEIHLLALIVVDVNDRESLKVRQNFWKRERESEQEVWSELRLLGRSTNEEERLVSYLIKIKTDWYFPDQCQLCGLSKATNEKEMPLMCVDSSSSAPSQIFISEKACYSAASNIADGTKKENDERVEQMKGCITYGHVTRGKNHYQFFIDAEKYYDKCADEIQSWLNRVGESIHAADAQKPDICIVLTPFKEETIPFVHDICKILFSGKQIFILQLDSRDLYRENIRTKYRNIISTIEGKNPKTIGVYFIDQIIVNGGSFRRLWGMAQTLLAEADCPKQEVDGIFTLINRNSKDKIREMISSPEHYYAFVHLAIPNFRMDSTGCPICALQRQYQLMEKRSATNWLAKRYRGLENKHMLRSLEEYQAAEKAEMLGRHGYYKWMKQWVYHHLKVGNNGEVFQSIEKKQQPAFNKLTNFPPNEGTEADAFCDSYEAWTQQIRGICIESFSKEKEREEEQIALLRKAIDERNYMRLWCTHRAYSELDQKRPVTKADAIALILQLICDEIEKVSESEQHCKDKRAEWLISYVKVLSRDLLGKYWIVKSAMFDIMKALIEAMLVEPKNRERYWGQLDTGDAETTKRLKQLLKVVVFPDLRDKPNRTRALSAQVQYQLMVTLVKRLSAMQSTYLLQEETILKLILGFARIQSKHYCYPDYDTDELCGTCAKKRYFHLNEVPNNKKFAERLLQFVKWTSMSGKDESKDFLTEKTIEKLLEGEKLHGKASGLNTATIYDVIWAFYVENNSVIYSGIERWAKTVENVPEKEWPGEVGVQLENVEKDRRNNALFSMLNFMEQATDYANPKKGKQSVLEQQIIAMLTLFVKLDNLEKRVKADNTLDNDKLPYELEEVCNAMNEIMDCVESRIVYRQGNQTKQLAASSIAIDAFDTAWKMSEILELIRAKSKTADEDESEETGKVEYSWWDGDAYCVEKGDSKIHVRVRLEIPRDQAREKPIEIFLLFRDCDIQLDKSDQDKNKSDKGENNKYIELFYRLRNILFLRSTLVTVLQRKLFTLMHCYDEYDYISRLDDSDRIMHISDLHATKKMEENIKFYLQSNMPGKNDDNPLKANLLVITGDVAQGAPNASAFWANYRAAEQIIKEIAKWCFCSDRAGKQVVKHDWRKRIVIIPGNHDYVSTSDLSTTINANRSTGTSQVIDTENGSTMSKFGYYIDFIRELLDININDLIENGLTEVRNYTNLKTRIISLNSCAKANALKTNKVGVNRVFVDRLKNELEQEEEALNTVVLVHHGPECEIDYVHDTYQHPYLLDDEIGKITKDGVKGNLSGSGIQNVEELSGSKEKEFLGLYLSNDSIEHGHTVRLDIVSRAQYLASIQKEREKTQMARYIRAKENAERLNDSYMNLYYEMKKDQRISSEDRDEYRQKLEEIRDSAKGVSKHYVYLSGHTHVTRGKGETEYWWHEIACTYERKYEEDRSCFVPNCTWKFKQKEYFNYGMLTFNESGVFYEAYKGIDELCSSKP